MSNTIHTTAAARPASKTAMLAAACRARATQQPSPLCVDPWASALAGEEGEALLDELLECYPNAFPKHDLLVGLRAGYIDAYITQRTRDRREFHQVVVLGAGLDTRAARLAHEGVTYYEVDHPESQAYKLQRLRELRGYPVEAATYVVCDFEHADYLEQLSASGFRPEEPALFILEGVVHYLTEALVRRALEPIARRCHPASTVVFDYLSGVMDDYDTGDTSVVRDGEAVLWTSENPLPLLEELRFRHVRTMPFDQLFASATGHVGAQKDFIHTCFFARATRSTREPPYTW